MLRCKYTARLVAFEVVFLLRYHNFGKLPNPVAARSKAWVCARLLGRIAGSNPAGGMDLCYECCVLAGRSLCFGPIPFPEEFHRVCQAMCDQVQQNPPYLQ
jgi:hypothetical protein